MVKRETFHSSIAFSYGTKLFPNILARIVDSKFQLQQTILIFGKNFQKKYTSGRKHKKMIITIECFIFELVYVPIFSLAKG